MGFEIHLRGVRKTFVGPDGTPGATIGPLDLGGEPGGLVLLTGPSGTGKSTLLNLMAGLLLPDAGTIEFGPHQIHALGRAARDRLRAQHVGYVYQTFNLLSPLTVFENLWVPRLLAGHGRPDDPARARALLEQLGLGPQAERRPFRLSVGQRQRVAVARALLHRPALLLADEPTASLDPEAGAAVRSLLLQARSQGTTVVVASHDQAFREASVDAHVVLPAAAHEGAA